VSADVEAQEDRWQREEAVLTRAAGIKAQRDAMARPLPPAHEPKRTKAHWDFLLEEMVWLSKEFQKCAALRPAYGSKSM